MHKLKVRFSKDKEMLYIAHLDVLRLFQRALRRAKLPFYLSKGFNPHPKISFKRALPLGKLGLSEEACFFLEKSVKEDEFIKLMNKELPPGVSIKDAVYEC